MIPLAHADRCARAVAALLRPACADLAVCGSVRRRREQVKDLELVLRPAKVAPVFGEPASGKGALEALLARLLFTGDLKRCPDPARRLDGPRQKRLWFPEGRMEVDLFIAAPDGSNWGNTVAIRTGSFAFSKLLVTKRSAGGLMPKGHLHHDGYLWRLGQELVPCPTEADFFLALGIAEPPPPYDRDEACARRLRAQVAREQVAR